MKVRKLFSLAALAAAMLGVSTAWLSAAPVPYTLTIDSSQSFITQSGSATIDLGPPIGILVLPIGPQAPAFVNNPGPAPFGSNGNKAFYSGSIDITLDAGSTIQFDSAVLDALISSNAVGWAPEEGGGPVGPGDATKQPADYGIELGGGLVYAALRDFILNMQSGALPLAGDNFASTQALDVTSGSLSYAGAIPPDSDSLVGLVLNNNGANGSISLVGNVLTLTAPISVQQQVAIGGTPVSLVFTGQIVASAVVPEPAGVSLALLAIGMVVPVWRKVRRTS